MKDDNHLIWQINKSLMILKNELAHLEKDCDLTGLNRKDLEELLAAAVCVKNYNICILVRDKLNEIKE